jgi:flagellar assembly protein FliH
MRIAVAHAELVSAWSAPQIEGRVSGARRGWRTVGELEQVEQQAWSAAELAGRAAGLAAAKAETDSRLHSLDHQINTLETALVALSRPLAHMDDNVHEQIVVLAVAIARQLVRRELRTDPTQIIGIVRETVALLPASTRGVRVVLHPEDAALVRERLATPQVDQVWSISEDPILARGDCRVLTDFAQIDARLESRLADAIATLLGDERSLSRTESVE